MSKPHIYRYPHNRGMWACRMPGESTTGLGLTKEQAYRDWSRSGPSAHERMQQIERIDRLADRWKQPSILESAKERFGWMFYAVICASVSGWVCYLLLDAIYTILRLKA